ncbi:MAG: helix-turn-helix domain-containing protein [Coriobacteriales bacterium]|nr:helix-turn-helix domain-containing protein [Coriobacteriales bacterium]
MKPKYYPVVLDKEDRKAIEAVANANGHSEQMRMRARILLALDESDGASKSQSDIADVLKTSTSTIYKTSKAFHDKGTKGALTRKKRAVPPVLSKIDGLVEARVIAMACSKAPGGHARWTLRLLETKVAEADDLPNLSDNTIARLLKKRRLSLT